MEFQHGRHGLGRVKRLRAHLKRNPGLCRDISVSCAIDHDFAPESLPAGFIFRYDAAYFLSLTDRAHHQSMEKQLHARFRAELVQQHLQFFQIATGADEPANPTLGAQPPA